MKKAPSVKKKNKPAAEWPASAAWENSFAHLLLNSNPLPSFLTDLETYEFIDVNDAVVKNYGFTRAELLRMKLTDIRPPEDVPRLLEYTKTRLKGLTDTGMWRHKLKNGRVIDVHVTAFPIEWKGRRAVLSIAHDVSEARRMESALKGVEYELSEVVNRAPVILFMIDKEGRILLSEGKGLAALGFKPSELAGQNAFELYRDIPRTAANLRRALSGKEFTDVLDINGVVLETHFVPQLEKGKVVGVLGVSVDISERSRVESALAGAKEELAEVVENAPIILFASDEKGVVTLCTGQALRLLGRRPGESVGKSLFEMYRDNPRMTASVRKALAGNKFSELIDVDGLLFDTHFSPQIIEGKAAGFMAVATDVTERRRADALLHQQSAAIKASMDGMAIHDNEGRFVYLNDAHARLYGYSRPEDLIGKTWKALYTPEELIRFDKLIMPKFWSEGSWRGEAVGRRQDGSTFPQEISLTRIEGGGLVCVVRDISERKRAESEHSRLLSLEKNARAEAEAASRAKDEFLAVVSHELRTPMTAILGWTWLLRSGDVPQSERNRALEIIERNMKLQAQIIEDLLDLSSIVTGKLHLESRAVELGSVLQAAADTIRATADAKAVRIQIECDASLAVYGDHYRLQQVFWNLLSNAVKFNKDGGKVTVRACADSGCAAVSVQDEGAGIESDFLPEMFELFRQGESSLTRQHRGLGIGLAIVKHLIELHGGEVSAKSQGLNKGSTFTVTLPLSKAVDGGAPAKVPDSGPLRRTKLAHTLDGLNVVVVDDEPDTLRMLEELLKHCGAAVTTAPSASEGFKALQKVKPGLLISDIAMPAEDGYSFIRKVRALGPSHGGDVLALALTARAKEEDRDLALDAGFQMYVAKPVEPEDLVATIRTLVKQTR